MITHEEWNELFALKKAINESPSSVSADRMERFTELFVKTLPRSDAQTTTESRYNQSVVGGCEKISVFGVSEESLDFGES